VKKRTNPVITIGSLLACIGAGIMLGKGLWAAIAFSVGYISGLFLITFVTVPLLYFVPAGIYYSLKRDLSWKAVLKAILSSAIGILVLGGIYLIPPIGGWIRANPPYFYALILGSVVSALSVLVDASTTGDSKIAFMDFTSTFWYEGHEPREVLRSKIIADFRSTFKQLTDEGYTQPKPISRLTHPIEEIRTALIEDCVDRCERDNNLKENLLAVFVFTAFFVKDELAEKYKGRLLYFEMESKSDEDEAFTQSLHAEEYRLIDVWNARFGNQLEP
jgi:hypothetical protein